MDRGVRSFPAHVLMCLDTRSWLAALVGETGGTLIACRPQVHDWKDFTDGFVLAVQGACAQQRVRIDSTINLLGNELITREIYLAVRSI